MKPTNPFGLATLTPYLSIQNARNCIEFLQNAFGAQVRGKIREAPNGQVQHAELQIGDSVLMIGEAPAVFAAMPSMLYLYVDDCEASYQKAIDLGAQALTPVTQQAHGDQNGMIKDPSGNIWVLSTHVGTDANP